jgi:hypothetical protein
MTKEQKVNRKDVLPMIESIKELTEKIAVIVETIPEGYIRTSYETSVKNLRVKNDNFLTVKSGGPRGLSDEEKAVIAKMRAEKAALSKVPADSGDGENTPSEPIIEKPVKKPKNKH